MPTRLTRPANVLTVTLSVLVCGLLVYLGAARFGAAPVTATAAKSMAPTRAQLRQALSLAGISARPLAAAGLNASQVTVVIANARTHLTENGQAFQSALELFRERSLRTQRLERGVRSGVASAEEVSAFSAAREALANATTARDTAIESLFTAATANLGQSAKQTLAAIRANKARELPIQYLVANHTDEEWTALRDALANNRVAARTGEEPNAAAQQLVASANTHNAVASAASGIENLESVTTAWNAGVSQ